MTSQRDPAASAADPSRFVPATPIAEAVARQAVDWFVRLRADKVGPDVQLGWRAWVQADAEHARAWDHLQHCAGDVAGLSSPLAHAALACPAGSGRRRFMKSAALLAAGAGAAWWGVRTEPWQPLLADVSTRVGEQRRITLPDGSRVLLNTDSAIDIGTGGERRIRLARGEIMVDALRAEGAPPFIVQTRHGEVETPGSRLALRLEAARSVAHALTGPLLLTPAGAPDLRRELAAGQHAAFTAALVELPTPSSPEDLSWSDGVLAAHNMRLEEFLAELARYRPGVIRCDPQVASLRVSGVYPLDDTGKVLDTLALTLPVRVRSLTRYWVSLGPREGAA
ncbi:FecR domain-containing protein [Achromobacter sp. NPDC058515]|uniref:FecR domain-containing protein n=1 Tax=Achromobacter sp. NPDC058515 TaxID=3346533 RepID=UPI0036682E0D